MDPTPAPEPSPVPPFSGLPPVPDEAEGARGRRILWIALMVLVVFPLAWLVCAFFLGLASISLESLRLERLAVVQVLLWITPLLLAGIVAFLLGRRGLRRGWHSRKGLLWGWGVAATGMAALVAVGAVAFSKVRESSKLKSMLPRQPAAAIDQFYLEYPYRIFLQYDEIVGATRYVKAYNPVDGEDLRVQFPIRQGWSEPLPVRLPDGTTVRRLEVLAAIGQSGLIVTYPRPQDDQYDPKRVYRLDCGVSFRDWHVVNLPPDPAGREGRDQDGVHTYQFPDGRRFEITYRGGVPDGPFRAYHADGAPWGEATYRNGRVIEAWLITRDGKKFDELKDGEAAETAMEAGAKAGSEASKQAGLEKVRAGDFAGAIDAFTRALAINPTDAALFRSRAEARKSAGDLDGAIDDFCAAEGFSSGAAAGHQLPDYLQKLFLERGRRQQAKGDLAGAATDFRTVAKTASWNAEERIRNRDYAGVSKELTEAIGLTPLAELYQLRADSQRMLRNFKDAEADYTSAIELAERGAMLIPANQRVLPAQWRYQRGHARRLLGNQAGAAEDFRAAQPGLGLSAQIQRTDAAFWLFLVQCEQGRKADATAELAKTDQSGWMEWNRQYARFLLGEATEAQLDAYVAAHHNDDILFRASFFGAMQRRFAGDTAGALVRFQQAYPHSTYDDFAKEETRQAIIAGARIVGAQKLAAGDFMGARAEFKQALALAEPDPADLLALSGDAKRGLADLEGALLAYQEALRKSSGETEAPLRTALEEKITALTQELKPIREAKAAAQAAARAARSPSPQNPATPKPPASRLPPNPGLAKLRARDYAGAIAEFTKTIEKNPADAEAYRNRADAKRLLGETDGAIADYTSVAEHSPEHDWRRVHSLYARGHLHRLKNDLSGAAEDFRAAFRAGPHSTNNSCRDAALWLYFVNRALAQPDAAAELEKTAALAARQSPPWNAWAQEIAGFLTGRVPEQELLAQVEAGDPRSVSARRTEALFYSGMAHRLAGDDAGALERFRHMLEISGSERVSEFNVQEARRAVQELSGKVKTPAAK